MQSIVLILNFLPAAILTYHWANATPFGWGPKYWPSQIGLVVIALLRMSAQRPIVPLEFIKQPVVIAFGLYCIWACFSLSFARSPADCRDALWAGLWFAVVPTYVVACGPQKPGDLFTALYPFLIVALFGAEQAFQYAVGARFTLPYMITGWGSKNALADIYSTAMLVCFAIFLTRQNRWWKLVSAIGTLIGLLGMLATQSRGAILGTVLAAFVVMLLVRVRWQIICVSMIMVVVLALGIFMLLPSEILERNLTTSEGSSIQGRVEVISTTWKLAKTGSFKPVGFGNGLPLEDNTLIRPDDMPNIFLQDYIQLGPVGLLLSFAWMGLSIWLCIGNGLVVQRHSRLETINACATGVLIQMAYHACVDSFWSQIVDKTANFLFLGMAIFVRIAIEAQQKKAIKALTDAQAINAD